MLWESATFRYVDVFLLYAGGFSTTIFQLRVTENTVDPVPVTDPGTRLRLVDTTRLFDCIDRFVGKNGR